MVGTLADKVAALAKLLDRQKCEESRLILSQSATKQYEINPATYFLSAIRVSNRPKCLELARALGQMVADLLEGNNPIKEMLEDLVAGRNVRQHRDWYYETKVPGVGSPIEKVVMGTLARILLEEDLQPTVACNMLIVSYVHVVRAALETLEGKTHDKIMDELGAWMRARVSQEEFCNGLT